MSVECAQCHEPLAPPPAEAPKHRDPCPKCGSQLRTFSLAAAPGNVGITGSPADIFTTQSPPGLLNAARSQLAGGDYGAAIVTANTACEVAIRLAAAVRRDPKSKLRWSPNAPEVVGKFEAWTGVAFSKESFWPAYLAMYRLRNGAAHEGRKLLFDEAQRAIDTATEFVGRFGY
jgi:hypothetical protein